MSVRALSWSFGLRLDDMAAKSALHALADHADDAGLCWPSIARVALCMGCSESTARRALRRLVALGLVRSDASRGGAGITNRFVLNFDWVPAGEPCQDDAENPVNLEPCQDATLSSCTNNPVILRQNPVNVTENPGTLTPEPSRTVNNHQGTVRETRGTRLPTDWIPNDDDTAFAQSLGLDVQATAAKFGDYWRAKPGAGGRKLDWPATWRNWCRREAGDRPAGVRPVRPVHAPRGNDAFFEQLARIASRDQP